MKFRSQIEKNIKKYRTKPTVFPPVKTIFEKFPTIQHKTKKDREKTKSK